MNLHNDSLFLHVQALKDVMGPDQDIPGPEISAGSRVMAWWFDEYCKYKGFSPACVTGAPNQRIGVG
jgi:glutamate dehydrogenase (NAD(P)+)